MTDFLHTIGGQIVAAVSGLVLLLTGAVSGNDISYSRSNEGQVASAAVAVSDTRQITQMQSGVATSSATTTVVNNFITQPIIERTVQTALPQGGYITQAELANQLNALSNMFGKTIYGATYPAPATNYSSGGVFNTISLMSKIDNLSGTNLSGVTVNGVQGLTDADIPDGITASNYLALSGGTLSGDLAIAGNFIVSGAQTLSGAITIPYLSATSTVVDSSFVRLTATNATTTNATSTNFSVLGSIVAPFYTATSSTASQLPYASSTAITISGTASTSALVASNSFTLGSVTGFLKAVAGAVSTALVNLASDVTGILPVANGGTGQTAFGQGWLNSDGTTLSASTSPTVNYVTATSTTHGSSFAATTTAPYFALSQLGSSGAPALTFSGNMNTGIFSPAANTLAWTTGGAERTRLDSSGNFLIGTTTSGRTLTVFNTAANAQQRISYDTTRYAEFYVDASGDLHLSATGKNLRALDSNFYLCDGGACPTTPVQGYPTFTSQGNLVSGGTVYAAGFAPVTCPSGMIPVPASPADGTNGFCVDKYEAQSSSGNEVSVQGGSPWVSITQYSARAECRRAGKHLITEAEWMAIAHNVENVGWNWNGVVAGTNQMSDGHSDNSPASALATAADASSCSGTGQTCDLSTWDSQRRVYKLSNDQYIWDFGGNVWEWVDQTVTNDYPIVNSAAAGWQACSTSGDGICGNTRTTNDQWYRGGFATIAGFIRGGGWSDGADDGAFALALNGAPSSSFTNIGFRCSR